MRDAVIMSMQKENSKLNFLMFRQFQFLETRLRAFEFAFTESTFKLRLIWLFRPKMFKALVDKVHLEILRQEQKKAEESSAKTKNGIIKPTIVS